MGCDSKIVKKYSKKQIKIGVCSIKILKKSRKGFKFKGGELKKWFIRKVS